MPNVLLSMELRSLTKAEEEVMLILWEMEKGFVKDILEQFPEPKPAYNTVSTMIRILEKKGFVNYTAHGKTHEYYPVISRDEYKRHEVRQLMENYFDNSVPELVSFFVKSRDLKEKELEEVMNLLELQKKKTI